MSAPRGEGRAESEVTPGGSSHVERQKQVEGQRRAKRTATKRRIQRSRRTTITIKKARGSPERTTIYEEYYEEEW